MKATSLYESYQTLTGLGKEIYDKQKLLELGGYWKRALSEENPFWYLVEYRAFFEQGVHLLACIDPRLPRMGFIGFYEARQNIATAPLINRAADWLREQGCRQIVGPFDGMILQRYRFCQNEGQAFRGEPINPEYYIEQFRKAGFKPFNHYVSGIRKDLETIIPLVEAETKNHPDFVIRPIDLSNYEAELRLVYDLSLLVFRGTSQYFTGYSWEEFSYWYLPLKSIITPRYFELLYHKSRLVGACHSFVQNNKLIMKTIGVLPEYQSQGVSRLMIYSQHRKALEDKLESVIYALVRTGNVVTKMPYPGVKIFRNYQTVVAE